MVHKILIHWHPQFSFFYRSFIDASHSLDVSRSDIVADVIVGANFLSHLDDISFEFLTSLQRLQYRGMRIGKIIRVPPEITGNRVSSTLQSGKQFKYLSSERSLSLFNNAIEDNLSRSLFQDFDAFRYRVDPSYHDECFSLHRSYSCDLLDYYDSLLDTSEYSLVVISHGNYSYYINLYLAAYFRGIETLVIHGGHGHSYLAKSNKLNDLCPSNMYDELCTLCSPENWNNLHLSSAIIQDVHSQQLSFVKGSRVGSLASEFRENLCQFHWQGSDRVIIGLVPILMEFQHRNCLEFMNVSSKSNWIEQLIKFGSFQNQEVIFYLHPDFADGAIEKHLQTKLIKFFSDKYNHQCQVISDRDLVRKILSEKPSIASSPSGTIASELAALGSTSLISNYCTPVRVPGGTLTLDSHISCQDISASLDICFSKPKPDIDSVSIEQLTNVIRLYKAIGKYNSSTLYLHTAMDKIFFFGQSRSPHSISSTMEMIDFQYDKVSRGTIDLHSFSAYYSY